MTRLMSFWAMPTLAANTAVVPPMTPTTASAAGAYSNIGDSRHTIKTPAVTIVAAWIKAETGVGPSIASGSQVWRPSCADLPIAPMNRRMQIRGIVSERWRVGRGLWVPEADEEVGGEADALPAEEHLDEIVRRHQHQHREGEEREVGEEAGLAVVLRHIAPAIEMDERRDGRHHHQHHRGQSVDAERPVDLHRLG